LCPRTGKGEVAYVYLEFSERHFAENSLLAGEYPSTLAEAVPNLHVQGQFTPGGAKGPYVEIGNPLGLYRLVLGDGQNAFVGNGKYAIRFVQLHGTDSSYTRPWRNQSTERQHLPSCRQEDPVISRLAC
jgi:hypothetical protein